MPLKTKEMTAVAKSKKASSRSADSKLSFEDALAKLEQVVQHLEDGRIGLSEALARYEEGVKLLRSCHRMLEQAERKIELLCGVGQQGNPTVEPLDEEAMSLEEKADRRSRRRSKSARRHRLSHIALAASGGTGFPRGSARRNPARYV